MQGLPAMLGLYTPLLSHTHTYSHTQGLPAMLGLYTPLLLYGVCYTAVPKVIK